MAVREIHSFDAHATIDDLTHTGGLWKHGDGAGGFEGVVLDSDGYTSQCILATDSSCYLSRIISVATEVIIGFHVSFPGVAADGDKPFFNLFDSTGLSVVRLLRSGSTIKQVRLGGTDTSPSVLVAEDWHYVEVRCGIADASGIIETRVDLATVASFSGDTKPGTSTTLHELRLLGDGVSLNDVNSRIDNVYILDATGAAPDNTFWGITEIYAGPPIADGTHDQWQGSDNDNEDNFEHVDEAGTDESDYIRSATDGDKQSFLFEETPEIAGATVRAVQLGARARYIGAAKKLSLFNRVGVTETESAEITLTSTHTDYIKNFTNQPNASEWDFDDVNESEHGVRQRT